MPTHQAIDQRSLALAHVIADRIDADPERQGLLLARKTCAHWMQRTPGPAVSEWQTILSGSWEAVRGVLLREDDEGARLRQSSPFTSVLTPRERWAFFRKHAHDAQAA